MGVWAGLFGLFVYAVSCCRIAGSGGLALQFLSLSFASRPTFTIIFVGFKAFDVLDVLLEIIAGLSRCLILAVLS